MKRFKQLVQEINENVIPFKKPEKTNPEYKFIQVNSKNTIGTMDPAVRKHIMGVGNRIEFMHKIFRREIPSDQWKHHGWMVQYTDGSHDVRDLKGKAIQAEKVPFTSVQEKLEPALVFRKGTNGEENRLKKTKAPNPKSSSSKGD